MCDVSIDETILFCQSESSTTSRSWTKAPILGLAAQ